jgi:hypothetical protein
MSEIKTVLIDDNRISGITDEILMAVKKGPSSSVIQSYKQIANSFSITNAGTDTINSSYMTGVMFAEKDSNVSGRADVNMSVTLYIMRLAPL